MSVRNDLYRLARLLGHAQAVKNDRVPERVANVAIGRIFARLLGRLWR